MKLAEAYGGVGIRAEHPDELDDKIREMIDGDAAGDLRLPGDQGRELLPDDPVRQGAQRDDHGRRWDTDLGSIIDEAGKKLV